MPSFTPAGEVRSKSRLHVSVGHMTVMADLSFFGLQDGESDGGDSGGGLDGAMARLHQLTLKVCIPFGHQDLPETLRPVSRLLVLSVLLRSVSSPHICVTSPTSDTQAVIATRRS